MNIEQMHVEKIIFMIKGIQQEIGAMDISDEIAFHAKCALSTAIIELENVGKC